MPSSAWKKKKKERINEPRRIPAAHRTLTVIAPPLCWANWASQEGRKRKQERIELALRLFFFNDTATTEIYTLSLHDALPISRSAPHTGTPHDHNKYPTACF